MLVYARTNVNPETGSTATNKYAFTLSPVTALCVEQSEEWISGRKYLDMELLEAASASPTAADQEVGLAA